MTISSRLSGMLALAAVAAACGSGQLPTSPSADLGAVPGNAGRLVSDPAAHDVSSPREVRTLTGVFTDALTGAAAPGITMSIAGIGHIASDALGQFSLESDAADGLYRITASGGGVVPRDTSLTFPGQGPVISLIPAAFNTLAFDEMTRQFGEPGVLKRWIQAPALIIETSLLDRDASFDAAGLPTASAVASAEQLTADDVATVIAHLSRALPLMTGGAIPAFSAITQQTTAPGAAVNLLTDGAITVVRYAAPSPGPCRGYGGFSYFTDYTAAAGYAYLQACSDPLFGPALAAHELGHALGYGHVASIPSVMAATITSDVTEFDQQAASIAFNRPPGNRAPDVDPESVAVNQPLRRSGFGRTIVRPVP